MRRYHLTMPLLVGLLAGPAPAAAAGTIEITAEEFAFEPSRIEVAVGETVRIKLRNEGVLSHNLTIKKLGVEIGTIQSDATGTARFRPQNPGTYRIVCTVPGHSEAGMTGTLVVK